MEDCFKTNNKAIKAKNLGYSFMMVQVTVCIIILILAILLKIIDGDTFEKFKNYYNLKLNDTITIGSERRECDDIIRSFFTGEKEDNKENFINKTCGTTAPYINFSVPFSSPVEEGEITSRFGMRNDPITGEVKHHSGLDIGVEKNAQIYSVMPGVVEDASENGSYGKYIVIDHGNDIKTLYAHCDSILKDKDEKVVRGEKIALAGSTGESTGTHLHLEVIVNDIKYDPEPLVSL